MPILNHRDYRSAKTLMAQISRALGPDGVIEDIASCLPADVAAARQQTLKTELQRLQADIAAYEKLRGQENNGEAEIDVDDLGLLPIIGRITRRLSQRELAERLDIKEQQVQRYESERYAGISLARYQKTLDALGIELQPRLIPSWNADEPDGPPNEPQFQIAPDILREIRKRKWVELPNGVGSDDVAHIIGRYVEHASQLSKGTPFHRKSTAANSESAESALKAWRARVLRTGAEQRARVKTKFNIADTTWLKKIVTLSVYPDGPIRAAELLREKGIILVIEPQLPHTLLDGAALLLLESVPVIGLTLRHDRLDNFWFTLLHELGHIFLHFNHGLDAGFLDDLDDGSSVKAESEADSFAQSHLLPDEVWSSSPARFSKSAELLKSFAESRNIHPAIVAGRIRRDRNNYRMFDEMVGRGQVRRLFLHQTA
ncbi:MAG: ImmA/IrrE family metallo-endopeptidase [Alphaproteobacteria bacterium]|nr:ImmA/IrrE family metallo-endopeptidase [Alphaproteobacteria bacterium]